MKPLHHQLSQLSKVHRPREHPLLHRIHHNYSISRKTLFYIKEYGPQSNITRVIVRESIAMLLLAILISLFGGIVLEEIKTTFVALIPLVILLPVLNDLIGNYGATISSRFSTMLHEGKIRGAGFHNPEVQRLTLQLMLIAFLISLLSAAAALGIAAFAGFAFDSTIALRVILIALFDTLLLAALLTMITISVGTYLFKKHEDPNNILIPLTTSVADVGNIVIMALLIALFF